MKHKYFSYYPSPTGLLKISFTADNIYKIEFVKEVNEIDENCCNGVFFKNKDVRDTYNLIYDQLNEYFTGKRKYFELPTFFKGTDFQVKVWKYISKIPYGEVKSYKKVAEAIGHSQAARAVGNAAKKNPLLIVIPCHRVVNTKGELTGYNGGVRRKKWLLKHESKYLYKKTLERKI
jgi:methylated-DNA-[protein]-cysteine S-methyltransferase